MIEILKSGINSIIGLVKWAVNSFGTFIKTGKVMMTVMGFAHEYLYLIPGFLLYFCFVFTIIYIVNRILNGQN